MTEYQHDARAISDLLISYATGIDRRDWSIIRDAFAPDLQADYPGVGSWNDIDSFVDFLRNYHRNMGRTMHHIGNVVSEVTGDHATACSYATAVLQLDQENPEQVMRVDGFYDDELVRTPGGWVISKRRATMVAAAALRSASVAPAQS